MNAFVNSLATTRAGFDLSILRVLVGITFMAHGSQKLLGRFGGYGLAGVAQWIESIGLAPGYLMALMAGSAEFFGGLALFIGLLVRPAWAVLAVTMLVAIFSLHTATGRHAGAADRRCWAAVAGPAHRRVSAAPPEKPAAAGSSAY